MIRKIICLFVVLVVTACLAACSPNTVSAASSGSLVTPTTTESAASSSAPLETPTNTASEAGSGVHEPSEAQQGLPKNDNIIGMRGAVNLDIPANIPANPSVNYAWGSSMCEAGGSVYYISDGGKGEDSPVHIARMSPDRSQGIAVTGNYDYIEGLTADEKNIYFIASTSQGTFNDALYALSLNGGGEKKIKIRDWTYDHLQAAGGQLYWVVHNPLESKENVVNIMCMNQDGTTLVQLLSIPTPPNGDYPFLFLATSNGLYFSCRVNSDNNVCAIFHTDLQGQNKVQLNKESLGSVEWLFYDQDTLYFLTVNKHSWKATLNRMDKNGEKTEIIKNIGYFPDDDGIDTFCGVSGDNFYYIDFNDSGDKVIHRYDILGEQDKIIAKAENNDWPYKLHSVRGMTIDVHSSPGFYIVGNDLYYSFYSIP